MSQRSTILITGAAGRIGGYLRHAEPALDYELRLFDRLPIADEPDAIVGDLRDVDALDRAVNGVSAIVHLAGAQEPAAPFEDFLDSNIEGMYRLLDAARRHGVPRLIFASSNHANGFAPRRDGSLAGTVPDRPDSIYGVSKLFGEGLSRLYFERYGMRVACIRIGSCFDRPTDPRMLATWLSPGDVARLVAACLSAPNLQYSILYGISNNTRKWWELAPALALGYQPQDDAEVFAAEVLERFGEDQDDPEEPQGGAGAWVDKAEGRQ